MATLEEIFGTSNTKNSINPNPKSLESIFGVSKIEQPAQPTIEQQKEQAIAEGKPVSVRSDRVEPTFLGNLLRETLKAPIKTALSVPAAVMGEKGITVKSDYLGDTSDLSKTIRDNAEQLAERVQAGEITLPGALLRSTGNTALQTLDVAGLVPAEAGAKTGAKLAQEGAEQFAKGATKAVGAAGEILKPVTAVAESVGSTIGSAARRGKETIVEGVQEAQRVAKLPKAEKMAARSGLDQSVVDFVKTSSQANIPVYDKIIAAAKKGVGSLRNGTAAKEVVGKEIVEKALKPAIKLRDTVGAKVGQIVKSLPTEKADITPFVSEFTDLLKSVGVTIGKKGKLVPGKGAVVGDLPAYQNMFNRIKSGVASQKDLHDIRSAVFKEFNLAKSRQQAFSDSADKVAEQFRSILAKGITNKDYIKYSKEYADVMNKLTNFVKYTGHKGDLEKLTASELRISEIAQRILGNASARPQEVLDDIVSLADKSGKKGVAKDLVDSIRFSDIMEDFYGIQQTRSMAGQVARGTKAGVEGATEGVLESLSQGGISGAIGKVAKSVLGKTSAEQQKALEELIKSLKGIK